MSKEVILTGLRSNAEFHLGNYLGAILSVVEMQKKHVGKYQINMFIPDLHSFTTPIEHGNLYEQSIKNLKVFVAAGLNIDDPSTYIYRQSFIPAHSELTWILECFVGFGELNRMTQFKDKGVLESAEGMTHSPSKASSQETVTNYQGVSAGLFNYPVLMAADILLYGAKWVPVGEDQRQHVEFTRDIAMRMNNKFGELFILPEDNSKQIDFSGRNEPVRIRSLRNPRNKMSKSVEDPAGTILLSDNPDIAAKKVMSAETDSIGVINFDWIKQPGITNLMQILALLSDKSQEYINSSWQGKTSYTDLKSAVAEAVKNFLNDLQFKLSKVDQSKMMTKLEANELAMAKVANQNLLIVQQAVGLRPNI